MKFICILFLFLGSSAFAQESSVPGGNETPKQDLGVMFFEVSGGNGDHGNLGSKGGGVSARDTTYTVFLLDGKSPTRRI